MHECERVEWFPLPDQQISTIHRIRCQARKTASYSNSMSWSEPIKAHSWLLNGMTILKLPFLQWEKWTSNGPVLPVYICIYCITCIVSSLFDLLEACNRNVQCSTLITLPSAWPKKRPSTLGGGCYTKTRQLRQSGSTHTHLVEALRRSLNPSQFHNRSFILDSISGQLLRYSQSCLWSFASVH